MPPSRPGAWVYRHPPQPGRWKGCCPRAASRPLTSHPPRQAMPLPCRRRHPCSSRRGHGAAMRHPPQPLRPGPPPARHPPRLANAAKPGTPAGRRENDSARDRLRSKSGARLGSARRAARLVSCPRCARGGASLLATKPGGAGRGATSWPVGSQSVSHSGRDTTPRATSA